MQFTEQICIADRLRLILSLSVVFFFLHHYCYFNAFIFQTRVQFLLSKKAWRKHALDKHSMNVPTSVRFWHRVEYFRIGELEKSRVCVVSALMRNLLISVNANPLPRDPSDIPKHPKRVIKLMEICKLMVYLLVTEMEMIGIFNIRMDLHFILCKESYK